MSVLVRGVSCKLNAQLKVHDKMQCEFINVAAHELRNTIQPILGLSQILRSKKEDTGIQERLLDVIIKNGYQDNNIKFELDVKEDILVEADRNRVNQVISNLLNNDIKFTKQEGIISMKAEKKDNEVIISVKDNGRGIDPQIIPRLFTK